MALEELQNGRYRRLRTLGSGGMGEVHLVQDTRINRQVAIKVIRSESDPYPNGDTAKDTARLFQREARAIAALEHPNILPLYDFGEEVHDGVTMTYMVMPFCPDGSLVGWTQQRSSTSPLSLQDIAYLLGQAAEALQYAHDHHVIHLDVKPSNFLLRSNRKNQSRPTLLLADFGVARSSVTTASSSRTIRGTPTTMAPEHWSSNPVPASDQYALAIMAYELLTRRTPFIGSMEQLLFQHFSAEPAAPSKLNPRLPAAIDAVVLRALAKKPEDRYPSITAFAAAFEQAIRANAAELIVETQQVDSGDFRATVKITPAEAEVGTTRTLSFPGGQRLTVAVPAGVQSGQIIHLQGLDERLTSGAVLLLTIAIEQADETLPLADAISAMPTLYSSAEVAPLPSEGIAVTPTQVTPQSSSTPQQSFDRVSDHDLPTMAAADSRPVALGKQPPAPLQKRGLASMVRPFAIISGLIILILLAGTGLYFGSHLYSGQQSNANTLLPAQTAKQTPTVTATATPTPPGLYIAGTYNGSMVNQLTNQTTLIAVFLVQKKGSGALSGSVTFKTSPAKIERLSGTVDMQGNFIFTVQQSAGQEPLVLSGSVQQGTYLHGNFCNSKTNTCDSNTGYFTVGPRF